MDDTTDDAARPDVTVGYAYDDESDPPSLGDNTTIRSGSIVYDDVEVGDGFVTGHNVVVREMTAIGDDVLVGTNTVIDGYSTLGSNVSLQSNVYVPQYTTIEDRVFLGPCAVLTNDPYPVRTETDLVGPTLESDVTVGANATVLPDVIVGHGSFVAAGSVVTEDVPPKTLAVGTPARHRDLPERLSGRNDL